MLDYISARIIFRFKWNITWSIFSLWQQSSWRVFFRIIIYFIWMHFIFAQRDTHSHAHTHTLIAFINIIWMRTRAGGCLCVCAEFKWDPLWTKGECVWLCTILILVFVCELNNYIFVYVYVCVYYILCCYYWMPLN